MSFAWSRHLPAVLAACAAPAAAAEAGPDCFDALVSARIAGQVPTPYPDCGEGCIVMRWPWLLELDVDRVDLGEAPRGRLTVLALQHTYFVASRDSRPWWLRRNDLGGFNLLSGTGGPFHPPRCAADAPPAEPYIRPAPGRTLDDLLREGEALYGKFRSPS